MLKRCEFIRGKTISYDDEHRIVVIDNRALHFGANHYLILSLLLTNQEVGDNALSLALYQQEAHAGNRELMRKTISKLRARLKTFDLEIKRIHDEGYKLVTLARTVG
jgi:DNA-binding response OmpR family regulator